MRILHVIPSLDQAGAEKQLVLLCQGLVRAGEDVHVIALTRGGPYEAALRDAGVEVTIIGKRLRADPFAWWNLRQAIKRIRPDVVHTWMFAGNAYGRTAARSAGVMRIIAAERCVDLWKSRPQFAMDRWLARSTEKIIVNQQAIADFLVEHRLPADKIVVIPNGLAPALPSTTSRAALLEELNLPDDTFLIGAVGRLWPQKRVRDLIWAFDLLHLIAPSARLVILGDGPLREDLDRFVKDIGATEHIKMLGHRSDAQRYMPHFDQFWQGSEYEGLPNSVMEAMALGIPVLATDIAGHRELITPDETGALVPIANRAEYVKHAGRWIEDRQAARNIGLAGQAKVLRDYPLDKMISRYLEIYRAAPSAK